MLWLHPYFQAHCVGWGSLAAACPADTRLVHPTTYNLLYQHCHSWLFVLHNNCKGNKITRATHHPANCFTHLLWLNSWIIFFCLENNKFKSQNIQIVVYNRFEFLIYSSKLCVCTFLQKKNHGLPSNYLHMTHESHFLEILSSVEPSCPMMHSIIQIYHTCAVYSSNNMTCVWCLLNWQITY